ncbi:hypothetical protein [Chitinophaga sp. HK235]|nr:hypothetical protein [Chitinophaga sp. HK235]
MPCPATLAEARTMLSQQHTRNLAIEARTFQMIKQLNMPRYLDLP